LTKNYFRFRLTATVGLLIGEFASFWNETCEPALIRFRPLCFTVFNESLSLYYVSIYITCCKSC